jgi:hypothetical protein
MTNVFTSDSNVLASAGIIRGAAVIVVTESTLSSDPIAFPELIEILDVSWEAEVIYERTSMGFDSLVTRKIFSGAAA